MTDMVTDRVSHPCVSSALRLFAPLCLSALCLPAQFADDFDGKLGLRDPEAMKGWVLASGDGMVSTDLVQADGFVSLVVDARKDRRGIWWALMRRHIFADLDMARLSQPGYALRIEARVRTSDAPKRFNLHVNTQRTTDFHSHLLEFDIAESNQWKTVSMTTQGFDARPGDRVAVQLALMDWGLERYQLDIDAIKVDVVDTKTASPDLGDGVPYHPGVPMPSDFRHHLRVVQDAVVDRQESDANLADWSVIEGDGATRVLSVGGSLCVLLRWNLSALAGRKVERGGVLELTTRSIQRPEQRRKDFGMLRVVEILGGDPAWERASVTFDSLLQGKPPREVFNSQMVIDSELNDQAGQTTRISISRAVLQRLVDGRTKGLALFPLGSLHATLEAGGATLHFDAN